jgi:hypothetical protein
VGRARTARRTPRVRFGTDQAEWPVTRLRADRFTVRGHHVPPAQFTVVTFVIDSMVSMSVQARAYDRLSSTDQTFHVVGPDSLALMAVVGRLTHRQLDPRSSERPRMSAALVQPSRPRPVPVSVRLAGHQEVLRVEQLGTDGFVLDTRALAPGVWTTATFQPSTTIRVRVAVIAGAVASSGHQPFTLAHAADAPLLALVATLTSTPHVDADDLPPATVLPASAPVLPFVVPALR